ncbi:type II secretion system protein GspD [Chitinivibrio alkaliphilus]|uniref:Type IV pilus secretin PilQ n=1 Tax=Chitinivibrio alkaliphilus ACht1 TaxID=1313304 RepID=U7D3Z7_9BACT|nr:type IV pilus secretin PilQ [Chitinivibrio alkaliphilus]ERP31229.1 type IV pilus secretin PilQ [Chitinivibrio alkaliphilus ACht1]
MKQFFFILLIFGGGGCLFASNISLVDVTDTPVREVARMLTSQTPYNIVVSSSVASREVSLYMEDVSLTEFVEALCLGYGMWYNRSGGMIRLMSLEEYADGLVFGRDEQLYRFPLRYASSIGIAGVLSQLYGDRLEYASPSDIESFSHVGTDAFPNIGAVPGVTAAQGGERRRASQRQQQGDGVFDIGGVEVSEAELQQLLATQKHLAREQLVEDRIGRTDAFMTVFLRDNSILLRTVDADLAREVEGLIADLDSPTRQVLLEMNILEIVLRDGSESFVDLSLTPGGRVNDEGEVMRQLQGIRGVDMVNRGTLQENSFSMAYVNDFIQARLEVLEMEDRVKKVGSPLMLCANNAPARIFQGVETPIRRGYSVTTAKNRDGNITNEYLEIDMANEEVGVSLEISPSINYDSTVTLKIHAEMSSVLQGGGPEIPYVIGGSAQLGRTDAIRRTQLNSIVAARDQQSIALGGLIEDEEIFGEKRVPLLGRIPLLGFFFRSRNESKERREIVFMITPHLIFSPADGGKVHGDFFKDVSAHPRFVHDEQRILDYNEGANALEARVPTEGKKQVHLFQKRERYGDAAEDEGTADDTNTIIHEDAPSSPLENDSLYKNSDDIASPSDDFSVEIRLNGIKQVDTLQDDRWGDTPFLEEVSKFLSTWARRWEERDMMAYKELYHEDFMIDGMPREEFLARREYVFEKAQKIDLAISDISILSKGEEVVIITFTQEYRSDYYADRCTKEMVLHRGQDGYSILSEEACDESIEVLDISPGETWDE